MKNGAFYINIIRGNSWTAVICLSVCPSICLCVSVKGKRLRKTRSRAGFISHKPECTCDGREQRLHLKCAQRKSVFHLPFSKDLRVAATVDFLYIFFSFSKIPLFSWHIHSRLVKCFEEDAQKNSWHKCDCNNSLDDFQLFQTRFLNLFNKLQQTHS